MSSSTEVQEAIGTAESLDERRARLRQVIATPSERDIAARQLLEVETEIAARDRGALQGEAERRLVGIQRALGSLADQSTLDNHRLLESAHRYVDHVEVLNERYAKIALLRHEAAALVEVFSLPTPNLAVIAPPAQRPEVLEADRAVQNAGAKGHGRIEPAMVWEMTDRGLASTGVRSFEELSGTPSADLIGRKLGR